MDNKVFSSCVVCSETSDQVALHYSRMLCNGCRAFFKRTVQGKVKLSECKADRKCVIDPMSRKMCKACRFEACLKAGVDSSKVQKQRDNTDTSTDSQRNSHYMYNNDFDMQRHPQQLHQHPLFSSIPHPPSFTSHLPLQPFQGNNPISSLIPPPAHQNYPSMYPAPPVINLHAPSIDIGVFNQNAISGYGTTHGLPMYPFYSSSLYNPIEKFSLPGHLNLSDVPASIWRPQATLANTRDGLLLSSKLGSQNNVASSLPPSFLFGHHGTSATSTAPPGSTTAINTCTPLVSTSANFPRIPLPSRSWTFPSAHGLYEQTNFPQPLSHVSIKDETSNPPFPRSSTPKTDLPQTNASQMMQAIIKSEADDNVNIVEDSPESVTANKDTETASQENNVGKNECKQQKSNETADTECKETEKSGIISTINRKSTTPNTILADSAEDECIQTTKENGDKPTKKPTNTFMIDSLLKTTQQSHVQPLVAWPGYQQLFQPNVFPTLGLSPSDAASTVTNHVRSFPTDKSNSDIPFLPMYTQSSGNISAAVTASGGVLPSISSYLFPYSSQRVIGNLDASHVSTNLVTDEDDSQRTDHGAPSGLHSRHASPTNNTSMTHHFTDVLSGHNDSCLDDTLEEVDMSMGLAKENTSMKEIMDDGDDNGRIEYKEAFTNPSSVYVNVDDTSTKDENSNQEFDHNQDSTNADECKTQDLTNFAFKHHETSENTGQSDSGLGASGATASSLHHDSDMQKSSVNNGISDNVALEPKSCEDVGVIIREDKQEDPAKFNIDSDAKITAQDAQDIHEKDMAAEKNIIEHREMHTESRQMSTDTETKENVVTKSPTTKRSHIVAETDIATTPSHSPSKKLRVKIEENSTDFAMSKSPRKRGKLQEIPENEQEDSAMISIEDAKNLADCTLNSPLPRSRSQQVHKTTSCKKLCPKFTSTPKVQSAHGKIVQFDKLVYDMAEYFKHEDNMATNLDLPKNGTQFLKSFSESCDNKHLSPVKDSTDSASDLDNSTSPKHHEKPYSVDDLRDRLMTRIRDDITYTVHELKTDVMVLCPLLNISVSDKQPHFMDSSFQEISTSASSDKPVNSDQSK